jgi:hypothetical protein
VGNAGVAFRGPRKVLIAEGVANKDSGRYNHTNG